MKKALSVFLMAAMAFGAFADEPVADVNVAEFSGNAAVTWGVDLDSGTTGFQNSTDVTLKLNLLNGGSKSTTGDGVWGELVIKTDGDTFVGWNNTTKDDSANKGMKGALNLGVKVDTAKIHFGPAYVGITSDDTQTGKLKMDGAIRSADSNNATTLLGVGPDGYSQGIVAGYDSDMFKLDLDLRSKPATSKKMVPEMGFITKVDDKGNDGGVSVGDILTFNTGKTHTVTAGDLDLVGELIENVVNKPGVMDFPADDATYYYTDNYAFALEGEFKGVENLSVKAGVSYNFAKNYQSNSETTVKTDLENQHTLGYSASVGYKLALDDTFFVRPQLGFAGATKFNKTDSDNYKNTTDMSMAAGVLFGWGEIGQDKNAGVYFLDNDDAKKVTPGVALVAEIPLPSIEAGKGGGVKGSRTKTGTTLAWIQPSLYTGELIPGLTAAAYADIQIAQEGKTKTTVDGETETENGPAKPDAAMAFAFGVKYALNVEELTITPQFGLRFVNEEYARANKLFDDTNYKKGESSGDDYMNVKLGVDVAGLVDNTTFSVLWESRNLNNETDKADRNDPKLGTLNFKAKIAL
ncbi:MAG: autotransporter outer membrane beta-barrel domain-containing protein [Treponema sp.]|nr:autotransporter outer membrane beta-barrel domain-containing protein [Treponema sp.]